MTVKIATKPESTSTVNANAEVLPDAYSMESSIRNVIFAAAPKTIETADAVQAASLVAELVRLSSCLKTPELSLLLELLSVLVLTSRLGESERGYYSGRIQAITFHLREMLRLDVCAKTNLSASYTASTTEKS